MNSTGKKSQKARAEIPRPLNRPAGHASQFKPVVAQLKTSPSAPSVKRPVAPPVYKPQAQPPVAQRKAAQPKTSPAGPNVYRPQPVPKCLQMKAATTAPKIGKQQPSANISRKPSSALQRKTAATKKTPPVMARTTGIAKKPDVKQAVAFNPSRRANVIQGYLVINLNGTKFHFTDKFPPDRDDLRVGDRATFERLSEPAAMDHVLAVFKEWGKPEHGFKEFKSWGAAVDEALVPAAAQAESKLEPFQKFAVGPKAVLTDEDVAKLGNWLQAVKVAHNIESDRFDSLFNAAKTKPALVKAFKLNELIDSLNKFVSPPEEAAAAPERRAVPKREGGRKAAESKEPAKPSLTPDVPLTRGLQSVCWIYKRGGWKPDESGTPGSDHAELGLARALIKQWRDDENTIRGGKDPRWIGFTQNAAPCADCCRSFTALSLSEKKFVAGFVFLVNGDQGGYRSHDMYTTVRARRTFGIYFINGKMELQ